MWTNMSEGNQATLWTVLILAVFIVVLRLINVLALRSKRVIIHAPDGSRLEFQGMSGPEMRATAAAHEQHKRATADDVR